MKQLDEIKKKLPLLLLTGIILICLSFILINCGKGPQNKITDPDAGQFAVDLSQATSGAPGVIFVPSSNLPSLKDKEFTVEAWVKRKTSILNGPVYSRDDGTGGATLWVKDNEPKFAIRIPNPTTGTGTIDYIVESDDYPFGTDEWHHLAGVLVNAAHSHPSSTSCTPAAMAEKPHIDIYVDGSFKNCATTYGNPDDTATGPQFLPAFFCPSISLGAGVCAFDTYGVGTFLERTIDGVLFFNGIIDEVRAWTVARTPETCMNQELSLDTGVCGRVNSNLNGYLRFNEGKGSSIGDFSGMGSGSKEDSGVKAEDPERAWDGGWVSGAPIATKR